MTPTMRPRHVLATLVAVALLGLLATTLTTSEAVAQNDDERFNAVVGEAMKAYTEEDFDTAIEKFFEAKLIRDEPELVYNIARSYDKMGKCATAQKHYQQFLSRDDAGKKLVGKAEGYLEALGECPTTGTLALTCNPTVATVQIDGEPMGSCAQFEVEQGDHTIVVAASGYVPTDKIVTIEAGEVTATTVSLEIAPTGEPVGPVAGTDEGGGFNWLGFGLVAGGAALFGTAVVIDVINQTNVDELDAMTLDDPSRQNFEDALTSNQIAMWTLGGIGVASIITGTTLWILGVDGRSESASSSADASGHDEDEQDDVVWQLLPSASPRAGGSVGASLRLTF